MSYKDLKHLESQMKIENMQIERKMAIQKGKMLQRMENEVLLTLSNLL